MTEKIKVIADEIAETLKDYLRTVGQVNVDDLIGGK